MVFSIMKHLFWGSAIDGKAPAMEIHECPLSEMIYLIWWILHSYVLLTGLLEGIPAQSRQ